MMKKRYVAALSMLAGIILGGYAVPMLHAEEGTPAYLVIVNELVKPDEYKAWLPEASGYIKSHGGTYLAAGAGEKIEGTLPTGRCAVIKFDNMEALKKWNSSPEWQAIRKKADGFANFNFVAVPGAK